LNSVVCTLFEGDYHYGVGALANSLFAAGFRGTIFAGFRGPLPLWVSGSKEFDGFTEFTPADGLTLRFIPLTTKIHLTNYKPNFMLEVWKKHCPKADAMFYFDPDITIKCRWTFFEEWVQGGVALCEDVNSPMPSSHPIRNAWRTYYYKFGRDLANAYDIYVNGGFVGATTEQKGFLEEWYQIQQEMAPAAEGMMGCGLRDRTFMFCYTDQDALNITLMATKQNVSLVSKEAMDIEKPGVIMSHKLGGRKPWRRRFCYEKIREGVSIGFADKAYWRTHSDAPIRLYSKVRKTCKLIDLAAGVLLDRIL